MCDRLPQQKGRSELPLRQSQKKPSWSLLWKSLRFVRTITGPVAFSFVSEK